GLPDPPEDITRQMAVAQVEGEPITHFRDRHCLMAVEHWTCASLFCSMIRRLPGDFPRALVSDPSQFRGRRLPRLRTRFRVLNPYGGLPVMGFAPSRLCALFVSARERVRVYRPSAAPPARSEG